MRTAPAIAALSLAMMLTGCGVSTSSEPDAERTFPAPHGDLTVQNEFGAVDVREADTDVITVSRSTTRVGRGYSDPTWTLNGNTLHLASPCGNGYVGLCEPSYTLTVPRGTDVTVVTS